MLTEIERTEIEAELKSYPDRRAGGIDALKIIQRHRGWVSDEGVRDVAEFLHLSPHEVDAIATFYNLIYRRPVGRNVIHVCDSVSCWILGYDTICQHLSKRLGIAMGETTRDGCFTLLPVPCLGACDHAPAMMVRQELHVDLNPERIDEILKNCDATVSVEQ
jgi:NADH-quinone oxidoreductase subunit E